MFQPVTHVLFDMDGLILDTEDLYLVAFEKVAARFNKEFPYSLKSKIMGMQTREYSQTVVDDLQLPISVEDFMAEMKEILDDLFPQSQVLPGVRKLIEHLHEHKIPMGLATSSSIDSYLIKSQNHTDLFDLLEYKTYGSSDPEVKRGKPYPDIFLVAAAKFPDKPLPEECLVFEDSMNGVEAGVAAGMQVVMVPDARLPRDLTRQATLLLDSMEHFRPELFGLPPYTH